MGRFIWVAAAGIYTGLFTYVNMETVVISTRIPKALAAEIAVASKEGFLNEADFIRDALRRAVFERRMDGVRERYLKHKDSVKAVRELRTITNTMTEKEYDKWVEEGSRDMPK